jgi:hypothetical protein
MSFFSEASLAMIPSGYKTSKVYSALPLTGDGDLTFSRSNDTATRVGPDGLIEKVRTNLLLQSNSFDTTWVQTNTTLTSGQSGYDGSNDAWKVEAATTSTTRIYQSSSISANTLITISLYAKVGNVDFIKFNLVTSGTNSIVTFDLTDGTTSSSTAIDENWESVGGGWVRISATFSNSDAITESRIEVRSNSSSATCDAGSFVYIQDAQIETGDIATDYIATTSAAVTVGPVANVPRLDYLDSSSPRLLLEPQRTNLITFSEQFDNAAWFKDDFGTGVLPVVTANAAVSPDGYTNADLIVFDSGAGTTTNDLSVISSSGFSMTNGTTYTTTFYAKGASASQQILIRLAVSGSWAGNYQKITITNEWSRYTFVDVAGATGSGNVDFGIRRGLDEPLNASASINFYGFQVEAGAYATSYIPTLGAAVTRADAAVKTSASALIGQTEGTFFAEVDFTDTSADQMYLTLSDGTSDNRIHIGFDNTSNWLYCNIRSGGAAQGLITQSSPSSGIKKIAVGYKLNDYVLYINGVQVGVDSSALVPACNRLDVGGYFSAGFEYPVNQAILFPTRLSNDDLAALTA